MRKEIFIEIFLKKINLKEAQFERTKKNVNFFLFCGDNLKMKQSPEPSKIIVKFI